MPLLDLQQRPPQPLIFQGGVQTTDASLADAGGAVPTGYRRAIMADGSPSFFQQILPNERTANGQDAMRQGTTMTEIQQANPGASPTQLLRMRAQTQQAADNAAAQNFAIRNEAANRNTGVISNADDASRHRNDSERIRANADAYRTTPAGLQAAAAIAGIQSLFSNPNVVRNAGDVTRTVRQAQEFLGGRPTNTVNTPGATPGATPQTVGPSYQDIASDLDAVRNGLPAGENTLGSLLSRINRDNAGLVRGNPSAVRAYLQDRFGTAAYNHALQAGVVNTPVGPRRGSSGFWDSALMPFRHAGNLLLGGYEQTPDIEGRSLLGALERMHVLHAGL